MASAPRHVESDEEAALTAVIAEKRPVLPSRARIVPEGKLPVSEFALDRMGAGSPFGDDLSLPLPIERLTYTHPSEDAHPQHH
jgi:hypothetical protein